MKVSNSVHPVKKIMWSYVVQQSLLILVLPYFLVLTGTTVALVDFNTLQGAAILLSALAGAWLVFGQRAPVPLGKPLLLFFLAFAVSTAFSIDLGNSLEQLLITLVAIFLFALAADLVAHGWPAELFVKAFLVVGLLILALTWSLAFGWYRQWLAANPGVWIPTLVYRPFYANVLVMPFYTMLILATARLFYSKNWLSRLLLSGLILVLIATIILTSSRGGWLGTAAGLGTLSVLLFWKQKAKVKALWRKITARKWLATAIAVGMLVGLAFLSNFTLKIISHPTHGSALLSRSDFWPAAIHTFLERPVTGQGPFTFASSYLEYNSVPNKSLYSHAHSAYLNLLAEMGILGVVTFGVVLFSLWKRLKQRLDQASGMELSVVIGATAGVVALGVHNIFDSFHTEPMAALGLFIVLGAALAVPGQVKSRPRVARPYWVIMPVLLAWAELWMVAPMYQGVAAANAQDLPRAEAAFLEAIQREPWSVIARQQLALVYGLEADGGVTQALPKAIAAFERVILLDPSWGPNYTNLGALYARDGNWAGARTAFEQAVKRSPNWKIPYLNLGIAAEQMGDQNAAVAAYQVAVQDGEANFWRSTPTRREALADWKASSPSAVVEDLSALREEVASNPALPWPYLALAEAELKTGNWQAADHLASQARLSFANGSDLVEIDWVQAQVAAARGDMKEAVRLGEKTLQDRMNPGIYGPGTFGQLQYAPLMYRRPGMRLEILPQVAMIALNDTWAARAEQLAGWYREAGQASKAEELDNLVHITITGQQGAH